MINLLYPFEKEYPITQTYQEHKNWAIAHNYCWKSESGCTRYYFPGIDFGTPVGTKLLASIDGKVTLTKETTGYGWSIKLIDSLGNKIVYGHLSKFIVTQGQTVTRGMVIGLSGGAIGDIGSGNSSGPHLHWEYRMNEIPIDPFPLISVQPITNDLVIGKSAYIQSNVGANLRTNIGSTIALIYHETEVMITGSPIIMRGLKYYPVILNGYIAKDNGSGNIILNQ